MYTNGTESVSLHTGPTLPIEEGSARLWGGGPSRAGSPPPLSDRPTCASVGPSAYLSVPGIDQIPTASVDFRGRLRRTANVQDHVPRSVLRGIDAERHLSLPTLVDGREDLAQTVAILLRDVHDAQVEVELILRWVAPLQYQRFPAIELVLEPLERVQRISKELLVFEWFERIETRHRLTHETDPRTGLREVRPNLPALYGRRVHADRGSRRRTDHLTGADVKPGPIP